MDQITVEFGRASVHPGAKVALIDVPHHREPATRVVRYATAVLGDLADVQSVVRAYVD